MKPLEGVTIIDCTAGFAGPICSYQLGLLGAEVIKIEPPKGGDIFRQRAGAFEAVNAGKKSVSLDLKRPEGLGVLARLVAQADVLVDNVRPGAMAKLGVTWEAVQGWNPKAIWCSISGFGLEGPWANHPAVEWTVQAACGLTSSYVPKDTHPQDLGLLLLDVVTGHAGATAVLAALRLREKTGVGQRLDVAMLDIAMNLLGPRLASDPVEAGERRRPAVGRYKAKDREMMVMAPTQHWLQTISPLLGSPSLIDDPRFSDATARRQNSESLNQFLDERLSTRTAEEWEKAFAAVGVPAAAVRTPEEAAASDHVQRRGIFHTAKVAADGREVAVPGPPYKMAGTVLGPDGPVPTLGGNTEAVLAGFGYSEAEVAALRADGVV